MVVAGIYDRLVHAARGAGAPLRPLAREPVFGALVRDLARAELLATRSPRDGRDELGAIDRRLRGAHADALDALLHLGPRTRLDAGGALALDRRRRGRAAAGGAGWAAPGLSLADLDLDFPVELDALSAVFSNLLRNAQAAVAGAPEARVVIRADRERDVTGRQWVTLLVGDSAAAALTLESIEARESGRGLAIVRDLVRAWRGHLVRAPRAGAALQAGGGVVSAVTSPADARLRFVVCEDGAEYLERFRRFLGESFDFLPAHDFDEARAAAADADGILLDLDFRRTPAERSGGKRVLVKDAVKVMLRGIDAPALRSGSAPALGALTLLTVCNVLVQRLPADRLLTQVSVFNDAVQAWIMFNPTRWRRPSPQSAVTRPFLLRLLRDVDDAPEVDGKEWKLEVRGLVDNKKS